MAEVRLIDANALAVSKIHRYFGGVVLIDDVRKWIAEAPTVDAEPMRQGRWKSIAGFTACSGCGTSPADWEAKPDNPLGLPPYCHGCGAKMDGGADSGKQA